MLSTITVTTAANLDDTTTNADTTITTENTDVTDNVQNSKINYKNYNSDLDTSNSVTTNSIGKTNTSQMSNTTTNIEITTENTNNTNAKAIQKVDKESLKAYPANPSTFYEFQSIITNGGYEILEITLNPGTVYQVTSITSWYTGNSLKNLTIIGNGAIFDGGSYNQFLRLSKADTVVNVSNVTFRNFGREENVNGAILMTQTGPSKLYIDNCTFINSTGRNGGVLFYDCANEYQRSFILLNNSKFINNYAANHGGAAHLKYTDVVIDNCEFINSTACRIGGTLFMNSGKLNVTNSVFDDGKSIGNKGYNESYDVTDFSGSALHICSYDDAIIFNNTFKNNYAMEGGVIAFHKAANYPAQGKIIIANNTFDNNSAAYGAALTLFAALDLTIENNSFINNTAFGRNNTQTANGGAIDVRSAVAITINNNYFENNSATNGGAINTAGKIISINNTYVSNNATNGGAISVNGSTASFESVGDCYINNSATNGGVSYVSTSASMSSSKGMFEGNNATLGGIGYIEKYALFETNYDVFNNNTATRGGVFYVNQTVRAVEAEGSNYTNNKATEYGGVFYIEEGVVDSEDDIYLSNSALVGGAIYNLAGTLDSINNKLINNSALYGGASFNSENGTIIKKYGTNINNTALIGGAMYNNGTLSNIGSISEGNNATIGGTMFNNGVATVEDTIYRENNATLGGAVYNNASLTGKNNTFIGNNATNGGALLDNGTLSATGNNYYNNTALENGGAIYSCASRNIVIQHINIEGNTAGENGGAIYTEDNVTITSSNDVRYVNNSANLGGAVYLSNSSKLNTSADEFISNNASMGGAIFASANNTVIVKTKATFDSNNATNGAAIYLNDSTVLNSNDAVYKNGNATNGSAIYAHSGSQIIANGNEFISNNAENGAVFIDEGVSTTLSNGKYSNNTAVNGAAIYSKSDLNTSNLNLNGNSAEKGGAVYLDGVNYNSNQDTFSSNNATFGGAVYVSEDSIANISASTFNTNNATDGGAIYLEGNAVVNTTGTTYRQNNASNGGVMYVNKDAKVNVLGNDVYTTNTATNGGVFYNNGNINSTGNTYTNGNATNGGVLYNAEGANFTANNDAFTSNNGVDGAVLSNYGNVTITESTIDSNKGTNSVILNGGELTLTDNTISRNVVTSTDGYVILNNVDTATITDNLFDSNTDFARDMLLGNVQPQSITRNTYIDNYLNDTLEVPNIIEVPLDVLEYFMNVTINLRNIYNDTVRNGTVYFYDEEFRRVGEGVVVDGNASVRIYRPALTKPITNVTVVYQSLSNHYQDISLKSELHVGKTTKIVISPIGQTYVDDKVNVTVSLYDTETLSLLTDANITVYINGEKYVGNTTDKGYIVIPNISFDSYGNYPINATFEGNSSHVESTINGTIEVIKIPTHLSLELPSEVRHPDDEGYINVTLYDSRDNSPIQAFNITLNVTAKPGYVGLPGADGKISYLFTARENGNILVVASVHESNDKYAIPSDVDGIIFIERYHTHFHSNNTAILTDGTPTNVTFTLYDADHNLLKNKNINITIEVNGVLTDLGIHQTDDKGEYTVSRVISTNDNVIITAFCIEDYKYRNSSLPVHLVAGKNITWVAVSPDNTYVNKTTSIKINLRENGNTSFTGMVNLTVGEYGPVEVEVTDGEVVYNTPNTRIWPERQSVNVLVSYLGDENHTDTQATSTFTVFRAPTVTTVEVTENLDTKTVIEGNVTSEGYPAINVGNVTLTAEYTNVTTGLRETIDLGNATVIDGKFNLTTDKLEVLEEDYGRYVITARYNLNNIFYESTDDTGTIRITSMRNTTITIVVNPRTTVGTEESIVFALYDTKGEPLADKAVIITVNGTDYDDSEFITDGNGRIRLNVTFSEVGLNNITARFAGDDYYNSSNRSDQITVKQRTIITVTVPSPIHVKDVVAVNITLTDIDGKPLAGETIIANDHEHQGTFVTDENGTVTIPDVTYETYGIKNVTAEFRGSLFYLNSFTTDIIQVLRLDTILNITSDSPVFIGNVTKLEGYLVLHNNTPLANKNVLMYINEATEPITLVTDENGYYSHNYTTTKVGRNDVKVVFETDDTYWGFEDHQAFIVKKYITDISIDADRLIKVGNSTIITGILEDRFGTPLANKRVSLTVNGEEIQNYTTNEEGKYEFTFTQPKDGLYNILVNFTGDDNYMDCHNIYQIKVDKVITHINITGNSPVNYGDGITVEGTLFDEYGNLLSRENITVYVNGTETLNINTRGFGDAIYNYTANAIDLQNITFRFNGTDKYHPSNNTYQVNVLKLYSHFDQLHATNVVIGHNTTVTGYLIDESGRGIANSEFTVTLNEDESTTKTVKTNDRGHFTFEYNSTQFGINNITLSYPGSYSQESVDDYVTFTVDKLDVFIHTNVTNLKAGNTTILVNVTDENGNPIPEGTVIVYLDEEGDEIGNGTVREDGTVEISLPLEPGKQDIIIVYNGTEELYKYASTTVTITVPGYVLNLTINDINDTKVRNSTNITGFLFYDDLEENPIIGENVTIYVDGVEIANVTTGEDGNFSCEYNATTSGFKEVIVVFLGNDTHSRIEATGNFTVNKINTKVNITIIENTTVDYKIVINGTLVDEFGIIIPNANVNIEINGVNNTNTTDEHGNYYYEYTTSVVGENNITVYYDGNNTFNSTLNSTQFNVTAHPTNVTANITNPRPGNNLITINVTDENNKNVTTGNVIIKEDGETIGSGIIVNGELVTAIELNPGTHTLNITYEGITKYLANSTEYTVVIPKLNTTIIPEAVNVVKINDTIIINGTLVDEYNNPVGPTTINISINGINATGINVGADGKFTYSNTTNVTGINNVSIIYDGNDTYANTSVSFNFTVDKLFSNINVTADSPIVVGNNSTISGYLVDEKGNAISGVNVTIFINGENVYNATSGLDGNYTYNATGTIVGLNNVTVKFDGNDNYTSVNRSTNFLVDKMFTAVNITTVSPIKVGANTTISGRLVDGRGNGISGAVINITVGDDEKYNATTDSNGYYTLNVTGKAVNEYKVKVFYNGTEVYFESNNTGKFIVEKYDSNIKANASDIKNGKVNITVNVTDENDSPITVGNVSIYEGETLLGNGTLLEDGTVTTNLTFTPGKHNLTIVYNGTENYTKTNTTLILDVPKYTLNLTLEDINDTIVRNSTNITGFLLDEDGTGIENIKLTITVNGIEIANVTTGVDGNYSVTYNATTVGDKLAVVNFAGDDTYAPLSVNKTFTVEPIYTNVTVSPINNITIGGVVNINGTLTDELGLNVSNVELIITVNGKNYTTSTDEYGNYSYNYTTGTAGLNNVTVTFVGDKNIIGTVNSTTFNVTRINTTTRANITSPRVGANIIEVNVTETVSGLNVTNGPLEVRDDTGVIATGQVINGTAYIPVSGLEAGQEYNFTIVYNETNIYEGSSYKFNVTIPNHVLNVIPDSVNPMKVGETTEITGTVVDENNMPLADTEINVTVNGETRLVKTNSSGKYNYTYTANVTGISNVTVSYVGEGYENLEYKYNFTVDKLFSNINVTADSPIIVNNNTTISGRLVDERDNPINGVNVSIFINNENVKNVTTDNGYYTYNVTGTIVGLNNVTVKFDGNDNYTSVNRSTNFLVDKMFTAVNITTVSPIKVGTNTTISGRLVDGRGNGISGAVINITVEGDDEKYNATTDSNGYYALNVTGISVGDYKVKVFYNGSEVYFESNNTGKFVVQEHDSNVKVNISDIENGKLNITVNVTDEEGNPIPGGFVNITDETGKVIGNGTIDENGNLTTNITLIPGKHNITIVYNGTENSTKYNTTIVLDVPKYDAQLSLENINNTIVRNSTNITGVLLDENNKPIADAEITVTVNGIVIAGVTTGADGNYSVTYNATTVGEKLAVVNFAGDDTYAPLSVNKTFTVKPIHTNITVSEIENVTTGDKITITGKLTDELGLNVSNVEVIITINDRNFTTITDANGEYTYNYTTGITGENNITVRFIGDNNIIGTNNKTTFNVLKEKTNVVAEIITPKPGTSLVEVNVTDSEGNPVNEGTVEIKDGDTVIATGKVVNGTVIIPVPTEAGKTYDFDVVYDGTIVYENSTDKIKETRIPNHNLTVIPDSIPPLSLGEEINITGKIVDENNKPLANTEINITVNEETITVQTDENGTYSLPYTADTKGTNEITVSFEDEGYDKVEHKYNFTVNPVLTTITFETPTTIKIGSPATITGTLLDENQKAVPNAKVNVKVGNKTINTTTDNDGKYSVTLTPSEMGINKIVVSYAGNNTYKATNNTGILLVDKLDTILTVNISSPAKVGNVNITGTLVDENNNPLANKAITVTVNGKEYNTTTNNKGVYIIDNSTTIPGVNNVTVKYPGDSEHYSITNAKKFNVETVDVVVDVAMPNVTPETTNIVANITDENGNPVSNGTVIITTPDGKEIRVPVKDGKVNETIPTTPGLQTYKVKYEGKDYTPSTTSFTVDVPKINTTINTGKLTPSKVDDTTTVSGTLTDVNGKPIPNAEVTVKYANTTKVVKTDNNGKYTAAIPDLRAGTNTVTVTYAGNDTYNKVSFNTTQVVSKYNTKVKVDEISGIVGEKITLTAHVTDINGKNITGGNLVFKLNGKTLREDYRFDSNAAPLKFKVVNGKVTVTLTADLYLRNAKNLTASYSGSYKYEASTSEVVTAQIQKRRATLKVTTVPTTNKQDNNVIFKAYLTDVTHNAKNKTSLSTDATVIFKVNGNTIKDEQGSQIHVDVVNNVATYTYYVEPGTASVYKNGSLRHYNVEAVYENPSYYPDTRNSTIFHVEKSDVTIHFTKTTVKSNKLSVSATMTDYKGNYLVGNNTIAIKVNGKTYQENGKTKYFNIVNGKVNLSGIKLAKGTDVHSVTIVTGERQSYHGARETTTDITAS